MQKSHFHTRHAAPLLSGSPYFTWCNTAVKISAKLVDTHYAISEIYLLNISYLREVGDAQYKADAIKNVGFATAIETSDSIEQWVKASYFSPLGIWLEALQRNCFDEHGENAATENNINNNL